MAGRRRARALQHRMFPDEDVRFHVAGAWREHRLVHGFPALFIFVFVHVDAYPLVSRVIVIIVVFVAGYEASYKFANSARAASLATRPYRCVEYQITSHTHADVSSIHVYTQLSSTFITEEDDQRDIHTHDEMHSTVYAICEAWA